tara:strand:+ start:232 stop:1662 length:1431 start_codon:yes stop_codon:yes gene_type:complete
MKKVLLTILLFNLLIIKAQYLVSSNKVGPTVLSEYLNLITFQYNLNLEYDVDMYKIIYNTVDAHGQPTIASGALLAPSNPNCFDFPISVYNHGTSLRKIDVPSNDVAETTIGKVFSAGGYFTCMPDYVGMGDSPGLHPYVHSESEATATLDMVRAAREFIMDSLSMVDNGEVFLTGYSQGGHACMATNKYIQDNNLQSEFNVIGSAPCSGPYALSVTMADSITSLTPYSNPGYITYLLASYQMVYGNIFNSWSEILQSPYDTIVPPYFSGENTTLDMGMLNSLLPAVMDSLIQDSVLNNFINDSVEKNHPLWLALLENDNFNWIPENPVNMYYCTADEQVAYTNSLLADSLMNENGALDVQSINSGTGLSHGDCVFPALVNVFNWFATLKNNCDISNQIKFLGAEPTIYPNPSTDLLNIYTKTPAQIKIYSTNGRIITTKSITEIGAVKVGQWSEGLYLIEIIYPNYKLNKYFIKQ